MELFSVVRVFSLIVGLVAVLFIVTGLSVRGWMVMKVESEGMSGTTSMGLWSLSACYSGMCKTMSRSEAADMMDQLSDTISGGSAGVTTSGSNNSPFGGLDMRSILKSSIDVTYGDTGSMQVLMIGGLVCALIGYIMLCVYFLRCEPFPLKSKMNIGIASAILWALACILVICAVAAQCMQNTTIGYTCDILKAVMQSSSELYINVEMALPFALIISGLGAFFSALVQLSVALWICKGPKNGDGTDDWHEFANQNA